MRTAKGAVARARELLVDGVRFRAWLESVAPDQDVGEAQCRAKCPLARYLMQEARPPEFLQWEVTYLGAALSSDTGRMHGGVWFTLHPRNRQRLWARRFVAGVDSLFTYLHGTEVRAREALEVLERAERISS